MQYLFIVIPLYRLLWLFYDGRIATMACKGLLAAFGSHWNIGPLSDYFYIICFRNSLRNLYRT